MNIIHFLENETSSNPGGFGAESKTSAQQPYNLEGFEGVCDAFGFEKKSPNNMYKTTENREDYGHQRKEFLLTIKNFTMIY